METTLEQDRIFTPAQDGLDAKAMAMQEEVARLQEAAADAITDTRALELVPVEVEDRAPLWDRVAVQARTPGGTMRLRVLEGAHQQLADKVGIPWSYYQRMLESQEGLLADNVNTWFRAEPESRMVRMLAPLTEEEARRVEVLGAQGQMRAFLSAAYRPLDHAALLNVVLPEVRKAGAHVTEYSLDAQRFHFRFATAEVDVLEAFLEEQPRLRGLQEVVSFGGAVRNSETGHGALLVGPSVNIKRCTNVLVHTDRLRIIHLGGRTEAEESSWQTDTRRLDDAATFLKARDRVIEIFSPRAVRKMAEHIALAAGEELALPEEMPIMEFVGTVGRRFDLSQAEVDVLQDEFLQEVQATGRRSRWSLSQAMTATGKRVAGDAGFDRKDQLEELGWKLLDTPVSKLLGGR